MAAALAARLALLPAAAALLCAVAALAPPPADAPDQQLQLVVSLCRHGDRSPLYSFPSDALPLSAWPDGAGQLTPVGVRAQYDLGARLRRHYVHLLQFLSPSYRVAEVHVRSTAVDRTLMSAYAQLAGLFPAGTASVADVRSTFGQPAPNTSQVALPSRAQAVAIRSADYAADGLLVPGGACARHLALQTAKCNSPAWRARDSAAADVLAALTAATGSTDALRLANASAVADTWAVQRAHGVPLPAGAEHLFAPALRLSQWVANFTNAGVEARRLRAGLLLHEVAKRARVAVARRAGALNEAQALLHRKFVVLSAHDTTVAAALAALAVFGGANPPYNSTLIWEVYAPRGPATAGSDPIAGASVRVLYNGRPLLLPGCARAMCPLATYLAATRAVTVASAAERERECLVGAARAAADLRAWFAHDPLDADDMRAPRSTGALWLAWVVLIAVVLAVAAAVHAWRQRYAGYSSELWSPGDSDAGPSVEQRVRKSLGDSNARRAILM